ncbi:hypothetical protein Q5752_000492 [Cryptotrichosporon argae]
MFRHDGIVGIVFIVLYTVNLAILVYGYVTRRISFKSVFTLLLFHVCVRLAAQGVTIALAARASLSLGLLITYMVLSVEGYFSLVLCAYRFLVHHQQLAYPTGGSWLEGRGQANASVRARFRRAMTATDDAGRKDPWVMTWVHWVLIAANAIIVSGGSIGIGAKATDSDYDSKRSTGRAMRTAGQAIFLALNLLLGAFLLLTRRQDLHADGTLPRGWARVLRVSPDIGAHDATAAPDAYRRARRLHPAVRVLLAAWVPLIVRGIYGLAQTQVGPINYADPAAYGPAGFTTTFAICEATLAVLPEWAACCLLCSIMFTRDQWREVKEGQAGLGRKASDMVPLEEKRTRGDA